MKAIAKTATKARATLKASELLGFIYAQVSRIEATLSSAAQRAFQSLLSQTAARPAMRA